MPRPDSILTDRPGRLPRQSYPPQTGCFKLPVDDPLTDYLRNIAHDERWDEWDYCWSRLKYLPRWDLGAVWDGPPGWLTPHAFLAWACWHMSCAYQWLSRLLRALQRSHSPEGLLMDKRPINPVYMFIDKGQVEYCRRRVHHMMRFVRAGNQLYLPSNEVVTYRPDGLATFLEYIRLDYNLEESIVNFGWHPSRARNKAEQVVREAEPTLHAAAVTLKRHLGESAWSE